MKCVCTKLFVAAICCSSIVLVLCLKDDIGEILVTRLSNFVSGTGSQIETNTSSRKTNDSKKDNIVLTTYLSKKKDPQRNIHVPNNLKYMFNFYTTAKYHSLPVKVFHDNLTHDFVTKYQTSTITFEKVVTNSSLSNNDVRFLLFYDFLSKNVFQNVLFADLHDVIFWDNPFKLMDQGKEEQNVFLSRVKWTWNKPFMIRGFMRCYGRDFHDFNHTSYSAGVWGGKWISVMCILTCMVSELNKTSHRDAYNCNMPVFNWCVTKSKCAQKLHRVTNKAFVNPFRKHCDKKYTIVHDQCVNSKRKCVIEQNGFLVRKTCACDTCMS